MTQSLQDLEQDIERSRAQLDRTIDRLQDKMSVSGVVDDMLGTARTSQYGPLYRPGSGNGQTQSGSRDADRVGHRPSRLSARPTAVQIP